MPPEIDSLTGPPGLALVVGTAAQRGPAVSAVEGMGWSAAEVDDPYAAMAELCRRPHDYQAVVLSIQGLYREELAIIPAVKRAVRHAEVWLTDIEGRAAALAEAMRLGADALLGEEGLHPLGGGHVNGHGASDPGRTQATHPASARASRDDTNGSEAGPDAPPRIERVAGRKPADDGEPANGHDDAFGAPHSAEPVLTADELRALLHDPSALRADDA